MPSFTIVSPDESEVISTTEEQASVDVVLSTSNLVLRQSGTKTVGEGHFVFTLDDTDTFPVYAKIFTLENVAEGEHVLKIELVHNDGSSYVPSITRSVGFYVEKEVTEYVPVEYTVYMDDFSYDPEDITVNVGDTVTWVNEGAYPRSATCTGMFDSEMIGPGESASVVMTTAGECDYFSLNHPPMTAHITVNEVE